MNAEVKPIRPPVLRVFAWVATSLLLIGWVSLPFVFLGTGHSLPTSIFFCSHLGAFVIGLSSFERLGGISAGLAALTLTTWLAWASALSAAG
jgi:hypothetical protein